MIKTDFNKSITHHFCLFHVEAFETIIGLLNLEKWKIIPVLCFVSRSDKYHRKFHTRFWNRNEKIENQIKFAQNCLYNYQNYVQRHIILVVYFSHIGFFNFQLEILLLPNQIRDPFILTIDAITTRTPSFPFNQCATMDGTVSKMSTFSILNFLVCMYH